jgi:hypothetical protein
MSSEFTINDDEIINYLFDLETFVINEAIFDQ